MKYAMGLHLGGFCGTKQVAFLMDSGALGVIEALSSCQAPKGSWGTAFYSNLVSQGLGVRAEESQAAWSMVGMCFGGTAVPSD